MEIKCCKCGNKMALEDQEVLHKRCGNYNQWNICDDCNVSAFARIRGGKIRSIEYRTFEGESLK